jgi:DNA/RNA-binding domain of Phe-tRNA-synthetase-like protein
LPFGIYDRARIRGRVTLRLGRDGEAYAGIRKDTVHVAGRLALIDDDGPFGNPTSDSARTMVTSETTDALIVVFAPAALDAVLGARALALAMGRAAEHCAAG